MKRGLRSARTLAGSAGLVAAIGAAFLVAPGGAGAAVTSSGSSASLDTFQALNAVDEQSANKSQNDFVLFAENLLPPDLVGPEGRAHAFISQASALVTPSQAFPLAIVNGIVVDGRLLDRGTKTTNPAPGVPVASSGGAFDADFDASSPTPFQFAGSLLTSNQDEDDCTEIVVELTGPLARSFTASAGGDCPSPQPNQRGFVVTDQLPAGSYHLSVEYDATVDPEDPGTRQATGALDISLAFFPPDTKLTRARIFRQRGKARFKFGKVGTANGFECRLTRRGAKRQPKFKKCSSPKTYRNLRPGRYLFEVRAIGLAAPDATPAQKSFRIPR